MKRCPLCGNEYEVENVCPICNILLIDTDSNRAVSNESEKERRRREERERREQAKEQAKEQAREKVSLAATQAKAQAKETASNVASGVKSIDPKLLVLVGGIIVILVLVFVILKFVLGGKDEPAYEDSVGNGAVVEETVEDDSSLDDAFANTNMAAFETGYFTFELPEYWYELCDIVTGEDYVSFSQKKSRDYGGLVFTIAAVTEDDLYNVPSYAVITERNGYSYIIEYPSDVCFDAENEAVRAEYERLLEDEHYIFTSFSAKEVERAMDEDYILPGSDTREISESELYALSEQEVKYARNEIYARHGRRFKDEGLQNYFDSKSWYNGTISPDSFSESMLSKTERKNVQIIVEYEKSMGYR